MTALLPMAGHFPNADADFNHEAAEAVFGAVMKMDDGEARVFAEMLHGAIIQRDLLCHAVPLAKALDSFYLEEALRLGRIFAEGAVAKAQAGGTPTAELYAIDMIAKAAETSEQRAEAARKRHRDLLTGRFVQEHKQVSHDEGPPLDKAQAQMLKIADPGVKLNGRQLANFQRGYLAVQQMLEQYGELPAQDGVLHFHYSDGETSLAAPVRVGQGLSVPIKTEVGRGGSTVSHTPGLDPRKKLTAVSLSVKPDLDAHPGAAYHRAFAAAGMPGAGRAAYSATNPDDDLALGNPSAWDPETSGSFGDRWNQHVAGDEFTPSRKAFRRLSIGSAALENTLGAAAPPKLKIALKLGQHVGELGPEAQKVIGPTADRAAYRYRGTERAPDSRLTLAVENVMNRFGLNGMAKHNLLFHGSVDDQGNWNPSAPMGYLRSRLPKAELNTLQRMSGHIPPSEGFIISPSGKVAAQSVGYGDDHYLPFNLKKLGALRGGEYMRTRTWGGPTTEDIYTGLAGGARTLSVVSHNGVYTLEFDDNLKGGRRFNDKAAQMVARYGQLLDAVKSEQVTTGGLNPSRLQELAARANERFDQDQEPERYDAELERLVTAERRHPTMSRQQAGEAGTEFFSTLAERRSTVDGHVMTASDLVDDFVGQKASDQYQNDTRILARMQADGQAGGSTVRTLAERRAEVLAGLDDPDPIRAQQKVADAMGVRRQYDAHMKRAADQLKSDLTPLALNGQGYEAALTALQEQFPYYIKSTQFHPWEDARNGHDTGYVAPRHNRPSAALSGYFDTDVTGRGKAFAHTTRFQNLGVHGLRYVPTAEKRADVAERIRARGSSETGPIAADDDDALARLSTDRVIEDIRSQKTFRVGAGTNEAQRAALGGAPVTDSLTATFSGVAPDLHRILNTDLHELRRQIPDKAALRAMVQRAVAQNDQHNLFDLNQSLVRSMKSGGLEEPAKRLSAGQAAEVLTSAPSTTDYDFDHLGAAYSADRAPGLEQVLDAYEGDNRVQPLVHRGVLPAMLSNGTAVNDALRTAAANVGAQYQARLTWDKLDAQGRAPLHGNQPPKLATINEDAEGILRARQLARRYQEAISRPVVDADQGPGNQVIIIGDPDDLPESARKLING